MSRTIRVFAAALVLMSAAVAMPDNASARDRGNFAFGFAGPGFSFNFGRYPRYSPGYYPRYGYDRRYRYYSPRPVNRCGYWSARCYENWGYGRNYRGCMRYYGCR